MESRLATTSDRKAASMRRATRLVLLAVLALPLTTSIGALGARGGPRPDAGDAGADHGERAGERPDAYAIPGAAVFPEGIALDRRSGDLYVSSTTDGTIFKGNVRRAALAPFAPAGVAGRTSATGMQIDGRGRLFVAGAGTGKAFVLSTHDAGTIAALDSKPGASPTFVNDVALTPGYAYFTDSLRPVLLRVALRGSTIGELEPWLDLTATPFAYGDGFNANGIVSFDGGAVLVVVQSNTGKLFRVDTRTRAVSAIDLGGATLTDGDGLLAQGSRLLVVRNGGQIVEVRLRRDRRAGRIVRTIASGALMFPTTMVRDDDRLLVVNAQFDKRGGAPVLPFTVAAVALP
jgi:Cu-Zn family superoxide dismutase